MIRAELSAVGLLTFYNGGTKVSRWAQSYSRSFAFILERAAARVG